MGILIPLAAMLFVALATEAPQFRVDTLDGQSIVGSVVELSGQQLVLASDKGQQTLKLAEVRLLSPVDKAPGQIGLPHQGTAAARHADKATLWVELIDGSRLSGTNCDVKKSTAHFTLVDGQTLELATKWIARIEFLPTDSQPLAWPTLPADPAADLIVVRKKDDVDLVEGSAGDISAETVNFVVDGEIIPVKRAKVLGLVYVHPAGTATPSEPTCLVNDVAGWRLKAKSVAMVDGRLQITTTFGATIARPWEAVRGIDFSAGRIEYLSDLPTESLQWTSYLDLGNHADALADFYQPRRDRTLDNHPLRLGKKTYAKGLALSSRTEMVFKIAGKGKQFRATAGIDDGVRDLGHVQLNISGDGRTLYSGKLNGRTTPVDLDLDVAGVKRLKIVVDFDGGMDVGDYLDLCDARIVK
jgi:hypothetical protein